MAEQVKVSRCFGSDDLIFGSHELDKNEAFRFLDQARSAGLSWDEVRQQMNDYLVSKGATEKHVSKQLDKARDHFKPWLK